MTPEQQRKGRGDYKVASYDWPFDSIRGYMLNLNTQRAYRDLRTLRARRCNRGKPLSGRALAETLSRYSERGAAYVETLRGIIRKNELSIADNAILRDEPVMLLVGTEDPAHKIDVELELAELRASGELADIIASIGLKESN